MPNLETTKTYSGEASIFYIDVPQMNFSVPNNRGLNRYGYDLTKPIVVQPILL